MFKSTITAVLQMCWIVEKKKLMYLRITKTNTEIVLEIVTEMFLSAENSRAFVESCSGEVVLANWRYNGETLMLGECKRYVGRLLDMC